VLVQPEMERGRYPLVSIPPLGRGFSRHRYDHQAIPQHGCVPAEPASVSPGKIIVAPPRPSVSTSGCAVTREKSPRCWEWTHLRFPTYRPVGTEVTPCFHCWRALRSCLLSNISQSPNSIRLRALTLSHIKQIYHRTLGRPTLAILRFKTMTCAPHKISTLVNIVE
jgi:hypothetical protein